MHKGLFHIPAGKVDALAPSDSATFAPIYRGIYVGGDGNVTVIPEGQNTSVTFWGVLAGSILPVSIKALLATGTTSTNILGLR